MEYVIGALTALSAVLITYNFFKFNIDSIKRIDVQYTQSYKFDVLKPWGVMAAKIQKKPVGQSFDYLEKHSTKVVLTEDTAYWIKNDALLAAEIVNGKIIEETTKTVDTMSMSNVELDTIAFIVETLTKGQDNENPYSGN
jgi:hypothetical protein